MLYAVILDCGWTVTDFNEIRGVVYEEKNEYEVIVNMKDFFDYYFTECESNIERFEIMNLKTFTSRKFKAYAVYDNNESIYSGKYKVIEEVEIDIEC